MLRSCLLVLLLLAMLQNKLKNCVYFCLLLLALLPNAIKELPAAAV
jgi:hypothetical protein